MWQEVKSPTGQASGRSTTNTDKVFVRVRKSSHGRGDKETITSSLYVNIGCEVMKDLRWVIGDRVNLLCDTDRKALKLVRVPDGRCCIATSAEGRTEKNKGKVMAGTVSMSIPDGVAAMVTERKSVTYDIEADGMVMHLNGSKV